MFGEDIAREKKKEKIKGPSTKPSNDLGEVVKQKSNGTNDHTQTNMREKLANKLSGMVNEEIKEQKKKKKIKRGQT